MEKGRFQHHWRSALEKLARRAIWRDLPLPPPEKEMLSFQWFDSQPSLKWLKPRLLSVDSPYVDTFPQSSFLCPHPQFLEQSWPKSAIEVPGTYVVELPLGRTIGARGPVITHDDVLLSDLSMRQDLAAQEHFLLTQPQPPPGKLRRFKGTYALLNCYGTTTYHWLLDCLPRYEVLRRAGYDMAAFDGFFLRRPKYEAHYKTIELLGIPEQKVVWCTKNSHYEVERLVVPSFTTNQNMDEQRDHHPWVFPFLQNLAGLPQAASGKKRRLLINRRDSRALVRQIVNQRELAVLLGNYGFEEVTLGELDFLAQARLFASAEFIVAAHGGGLSNLCFCHPSTKLLELFAPDYVRTHFRNMARQLGMEYEPLVMERVATDREGLFGGDIRVDLIAVEKIVRAMLERALSLSPTRATLVAV